MFFAGRNFFFSLSYLRYLPFIPHSVLRVTGRTSQDLIIHIKMVAYRILFMAGAVAALPLNINLGAYSPALVVGMMRTLARSTPMYLETEKQTTNRKQIY